MRALDLAVIVVYLAAVAAVGLRISGRQRSATDYFVGERNLPWWAVCFSIIATETSTLTVISVPGVAYLTNFSYVGLAVGYLIGRILVAVVLLPLYFRGELVSAYEYLGRRFGPNVHGVASIAFLVTRLLAEGVRLFASAIPIKLLLDEVGVEVSYLVIIGGLTALTVAYTYVGGIKAVIWTDAIQMSLYLGGAIVCIVVLLAHTGLAALGDVASAGKFAPWDWSTPVLTDPYMFVTAVVGGAVFTMASHGSDQLIVQRVLACRGLADGRRAMVGSACGIIVQFALFSLVGVLLWAYQGGASLDKLGLESSDQLFPRFILDDLPAGISGLLIAGILAATMGSLSAALNSLSTSTVADLMRTFWHRTLSEGSTLRVARVLTLVWAVVMAGFASLFSDTDNAVIELGLSITGYTYGAMLGAFVLGLAVRRATERDALVAFLVTVAVMAYVVLEVTIDGVKLAFPWYVPMGVAITLLVGGTLARLHPPPVGGSG